MIEIHHDSEHQHFESFARRELDATVHSMDGSTRSRLNAMRHAALASGQRHRRGWLLPASLLMAMAAIALIWLMPQQPNLGGVDIATIEDMDLLAAGVGMDVLEDVEFYEWLKDHDDG